MSTVNEITDLTECLDIDVSNQAKPHFLFVSGLDKSYSTSKRRFVLLRHFEKQQQRQPQPKRVRHKPKNKKWNTQIKASEGVVANLESQSPIGMDAADIDPFHVLPLSMQKGKGNLVQAFSNMKITLFSSRKGGVDPFLKVLDEFAVRSDMILTCCFALTSAHLDVLHQKPDSVQALQYECEAVTKLRTSLSATLTTQEYEIVVLSTLILTWLAGYKRIVNLMMQGKDPGVEKEYRNLHVMGLRQLLISRGGVTASKLPGWIMTSLVIGIDMETWGQLSVGLTPFSCHTVSLPRGGVELLQLDDIPTTTKELLGFYTDMYHYAAFRKLGPQSPQEKIIYDNFQPGSMFYSPLLTGARPYNFALMMYFLIWLWETRDDPIEPILSELDYIKRRLVDEGIHNGYVTISIVMWIITANEKHELSLESRKRLWLIARLIRVIRPLSEELTIKLTANLLSFLSVPECPSVQKELLYPDPESFAKDVLADLKLHGRTSSY